MRTKHFLVVLILFLIILVKKGFSGKITTIKLFEDNSLVRKQLELDGSGKVLVIDGGGSTLRAGR
jgi:regulator of ribonuclease activity A